METIELKDVMNQLPVADLVKNLAGVDKNGVPSQFTMENIAAVVGALALKNFDCRFINIRSVVNPENIKSIVEYLFANEIKANTTFDLLVDTGVLYNVHGYIDTTKRYGVVYIDAYVVNGQNRFYIREGKILEG